MARAKFRRLGVGARIRNPARPDLTAVRLWLPEAARVPRTGVTQRTLTGTPPPPPSWDGPATEWIVYYDLTARRQLRQGRDFIRQAAVPAPGLNVGRPFTRADFLIPQQSATFYSAFAPAEVQGLIINPISYYTHPDPGHDRIERAILAGQGYREIFIDSADLDSRPHEVVGLALLGIDVSSRTRP